MGVMIRKRGQRYQERRKRTVSPAPNYLPVDLPKSVFFDCASCALRHLKSSCGAFPRKPFEIQSDCQNHNP
jgi:hypothetical protein